MSPQSVNIMCPNLSLHSDFKAFLMKLHIHIYIYMYMRAEKIENAMVHTRPYWETDMSKGHV